MTTHCDHSDCHVKSEILGWHRCYQSFSRGRWATHPYVLNTPSKAPGSSSGATLHPSPASSPQRARCSMGSNNNPGGPNAATDSVQTRNGAASCRGKQGAASPVSTLGSDAHELATLGESLPADGVTRKGQAAQPALMACLIGLLLIAATVAAITIGGS